MPNDLQNTWDTISTIWNRWAPPLRPSPEDTAIVKNALDTWAQGKDGYTPQAVLLGVTPELATMDFPLSTNLLAIDESPGMIQNVWPGDIPNQRQAVQGDWLTYSIDGYSKDIFLADGSLVFFSPAQTSQLITKVAQSLKSDGIFIARCFVLPPTLETFAKVIQATRDGYITSFHEFKFRVAMSLQTSFAGGVSQDYIWHSMKVILDANTIKKYSENDLSTGDVYKGKTSKHYYPTVSELTALLNNRFANVQVVKPTYQFGECCQTFIATSRR